MPKGKLLNEKEVIDIQHVCDVSLLMTQNNECLESVVHRLTSGRLSPVHVMCDELLRGVLDLFANFGADRMLIEYMHHCQCRGIGGINAQYVMSCTR